jgi:UDP-glucose 4-epimerase
MIESTTQTPPMVPEFDEAFRNARVLVTGDSGFIGTHLCQTLLDLKAGVFGVSLEDHSSRNLAGVAHTSLDLRDGAATKSFVQKIQPDFVFHLASLVNTSKKIEFVLPTLEHNLLGSVNLLTALRETGVRRIIVLSTSDASPRSITPDSPYAASKSAVETYSKLFTDLYSEPVSLIRLFHCFGSHQSPEKLIPYLISCAMQNVEPEILNPKRILDPIYIKDFIRGLLLTVQVENPAGTILDFGSGHGWAIENLASLIDAMVNGQNRSAMEMTKDSSGIEGQTADLDKTYRLTGWKPAWTLQQALSETIAWYKNQLAKDGVR